MSPAVCDYYQIWTYWSIQTYIVKNNNKNSFVLLNENSWNSNHPKNLHRYKRVIIYLSYRGFGKVWNILLFNIYRIFICVIYSRGTFVVETKGDCASVSYFSLVSAFVLVVLERINNALSRVGSRQGTGQWE